MREDIRESQQTVREATTPKQMAALIRNALDPSNHSPAVEAFRAKLTPSERAALRTVQENVQRNPSMSTEALAEALSQLPSDQFSKVFQATTAAAPRQTPSPSHLSQEEISSVIGEYLQHEDVRR